MKDGLLRPLLRPYAALALRPLRPLRRVRAILRGEPKLALSVELLAKRRDLLNALVDFAPLCVDIETRERRKLHEAVGHQLRV